MAHLRPCTGCARHVRANVSMCPFCDASLAIDEAAPALPQERLGRAARMAFGGAAVVAMTVAGCEKKENIAMPYGAPPNPSAPTAADAGERFAKPPPTATATATATATPTATVTTPQHMNQAKPYGAPPADGYGIFEV